MLILYEIVGIWMRGYLPQRVQSLDYGIKHDKKMLPCVKAIYILFRTDTSTKIKNFLLVKQIYQLSIHRLSAKMCTFVHRLYVLVIKDKLNEKAEFSHKKFSLFFDYSKMFSGHQYFSIRIVIGQRLKGL